MKSEHWVGDGEAFLVPVNTPEEIANRDLNIKICTEISEDGKTKPHLCCTIEGDSYNDIMQKYYDHNGWGKYKPFE